MNRKASLLDLPKTEGNPRYESCSPILPTPSCVPIDCAASGRVFRLNITADLARLTLCPLSPSYTCRRESRVVHEEDEASRNKKESCAKKRWETIGHEGRIRTPSKKHIDTA
ncbi:unnamed protein product [Linum trigynum]|uniref:Uncharacterized protein n=1 Tax=Linum trigynum TaxID=586398 RepID=A0AAV2EMG2_9ROSI